MFVAFVVKKMARFLESFIFFISRILTSLDARQVSLKNNAERKYVIRPSEKLAFSFIYLVSFMCSNLSPLFSAKLFAIRPKRFSEGFMTNLCQNGLFARIIRPFDVLLLPLFSRDARKVLGLCMAHELEIISILNK